MRRFPAATVSLALVSTLTLAAVAAPKSLEGTIRARQRTALALGGKGQWNAAFQTLAAGRDQVIAERRKATAPLRAPLSPSLRAEAKALSAWLAAKSKGGKRGEPLPPAVLKEYQHRQLALRQKAAKAIRPATAQLKSDPGSLRLGLLLADLDDTAATLHQKKGDAGEAEKLRTQAGRHRLSLYSEAGKKTEAETWASRLVQLGSNDAASLATVAEYYQGTRRFAPAIQHWKRAIRLQETDSTARRASESRLYYRQLAYCYDRLGKAAERDASLAAAARLEAATRPKP